MTEKEAAELRLSVSKSKTFADCKKKYEFTYIQKLPRKEHDYHIFGKFCHKVLEDFHMVYINGSQDPYNITMGKVYKAALIEFKDGMTAEMKKDCWAIIDKYLRLISEDKKNNLTANVIACEKNFYFNISDNVVLNGMIDRVEIDKDNVLRVCDYKTTKNKKYLKNDWFQLLTYAYALWTEDNSIQKVRGSYILLRHDFEYITKEFSIDEILEVKDKYLDYANQINIEKEYATNPTVLCGWCDHLDLCPDGQKKAGNRKVETIFGEVNW